jgi:hypothetical protein
MTRKETLMPFTIHFQADDDGSCGPPVQDVEAAKWQISRFLPNENGTHDESKNTWAKEQLVVEERDGKTYIIMPGHTYTEKRSIGPFTEDVVRNLREVVWRLEEVA